MMSTCFNMSSAPELMTTVVVVSPHQTLALIKEYLCPQVCGIAENIKESVTDSDTT